MRAGSCRAPGNAEVIGITGPAGGRARALFLDHLVHAARADERSVGVSGGLTPRVRFSGGSVSRRPDTDARPLPGSGGVHTQRPPPGERTEGWPRCAGAGVSLLDALGKDIILVETVGVGAGRSWTFWGVAGHRGPSSWCRRRGDTVQAMKAGLLGDSGHIS